MFQFKFKIIISSGNGTYGWRQLVENVYIVIISFGIRWTKNNIKRHKIFWVCNARQIDATFGSSGRVGGVFYMRLVTCFSGIYIMIVRNFHCKCLNNWLGVASGTIKSMWNAVNWIKVTQNQYIYYICCENLRTSLGNFFGNMTWLKY